MKQFTAPEVKRVMLAPRDILTVSEETEPTKTTGNKGDIVLPPDSFEDD